MSEIRGIMACALQIKHKGLHRFIDEVKHHFPGQEEIPLYNSLGKKELRRLLKTLPNMSVGTRRDHWIALIGIIIAGGGERIPIRMYFKQLGLSEQQIDGLYDCANPKQAELASSVLTWNNQACYQLARAIYFDEKWDEMPILGDALEEAGCINPRILDHCRTEHHSEFCWVLELILPFVHKQYTEIEYRRKFYPWRR